MIPGHIIEKARQAMVALPSPRNPKPTTDALVRAALEAVAADIWEQGNRAGFSLGAAIGRDDWADEDDTNPYERIEHT